MLAKHLFGTWTSCPHIRGRSGQSGGVEAQFAVRVECSEGLPLRFRSFSKSSSWASALWDQGELLGIDQGSRVVQSSVETSSADVWPLVKQSLVINLWYFNEEVKLEKDFFPWSEGGDLNLDKEIGSMSGENLQVASSSCYILGQLIQWRSFPSGVCQHLMASYSFVKIQWTFEDFQ